MSHIFSAKSFGKFGLGFLARFVFSGKAFFRKVSFLAKVLASPQFWHFGKSVSFSKTKSGL